MEAYAAVGSTSGIIALLGAIGYGVYRICHHSKCRSSCLTKPLFDIDVNLDTPGATAPNTTG
jgi:hypothetical protein